MGLLRSPTRGKPARHSKPARHRRPARDRLFLQFYTFDFAYKQHIGQRAQQCQHRDVGNRRRKRITTGQKANHNRRSNRRQVTDEVKHPSGQPQQPRRRQGRHQRPGNRRQTVPKERHRQKRNHPRRRIHIVGANDRGRNQQPTNNRQLARKAYRRAAANQPVRKQPRTQHTHKRRQKGQRRQQARLDEVHAAIFHQVGREPRQKKPQRGVQAELPQVDAPQFALAQYDPKIDPTERRLDRLGLHIHQPAAFADQLDFSRIGAFEVLRLAVHRVPDQRPHNAHATGGDKHHVPAERVLQPGQYRREKRQPDKLAGGVNANGRGTLAFGKPGGDHATVDRIGRRFQRADRHAQHKQRDKAGGKTEHHGGNRPQQQGHGVENAGRHTVHQPAAGDLHGGVGPAERREDQPDMHRVDAQLAGQRRGGNRQVAAVEVVDHHGDKQQHHDEETLSAGRDKRSLPGEGFRVHEGLPLLMFIEDRSY